jgi:hypothetical protein
LPVGVESREIVAGHEVAPGSFVISSLKAHSFPHDASSYDAAFERTGLHLAKYLPLTSRTSGEEAR